MMWGWKVLAFLLVLNVSAYIVAQAGVINYSVAAQVGISGSEYERATAWHPTSMFTVGDVPTAFFWFFDTVRWVVDGFPSLLSDIGAPDYIVWAARVVAGFVFMVTIVQFISGRRMD